MTLDFKRKSLSPSNSIPIVLRFVRPFNWHAEVIGLLLRELGQLYANAVEVQAGDFFVQFLGQTINADLVRGAVRPEV